MVTGEEIEIMFLLRFARRTRSYVSSLREKIFVNGVDVSVLRSRELYYNKDGQLITRKLTDYTKEVVKEKYATLDYFLNKWNEAEKKQTIIDEASKDLNIPR